MSIIRDLRKNKKISVEKLADLMGISTGYLYDLEKGRRRLNEDLLIKLCGIFNVSANCLLGLPEEQKQDKLPFDYNILYQQKNSAEALKVAVGLIEKYNLPDETLMRMAHDIAKYYPEDCVDYEGGKLAGGPKSPGTGVFDNKDGDSDKT
jgi:transcriptional regulator with XRE-family HTH domain